ncbi:MAG TPA: hypothetical protein ENJ45_02760 [Phaeodactylibacter sp.]|nr:hypothetical protein [Phaeodactylibacter sp.]
MKPIIFNSKPYFRRKALSKAAILLCLLAFTIACSNNNSTHQPVNAHGPNKAYSSDYVCPMHCHGSGSNKKGLCPICGMDYVPLKEHIKNGHTH